jgi:hypothetical protein
MTKNEAKQLEVGDRIQFLIPGKGQDRGRIVEKSKTGFKVKWDSDGYAGWVLFEDAGNMTKIV